MTVAAPSACPRCQAPLLAGELACAGCGALAWGPALERLSAEARWQEQFNPAQAASIWQECLQLLPENSRQYAAVQAEIDRLATVPPIAMAAAEPGAAPTIKQESLQSAVLKTGISMVISIVAYKFSFGWAGAIGFVFLILIHELGHVVANAYYGLAASPPIFIPYVGAVINLRQPPPNALAEAVVGIAGPIAGTLASLGAFGWYYSSHNPLALKLAFFGFVMNLFNLLPVPPLDGGRVAAAISPWIWVLGLGAMAIMLVDETRHHGGPGILLIVALVAIPRIISTLKRGGRSGPYYAIGRTAPVLVGAAYLLLLGALLALSWYTKSLLPTFDWL